MNKIQLSDKQSGIYAIKNLRDGKLYIGKSKNIYKRIYSHLNCFNKFLNEGTNPSRGNRHLLNAIKKYGLDQFIYFVVEYTIEDLGTTEINWILKLKTNQREFGYNLQLDAKDHITAQETKDKISKRLKKEWQEGKRSQHSEKLKANWDMNPEYKLEKSKLLTKTLTKYNYEIYKDENLIEVCNYKKLVELGFKNCMASFARTKSDFVNCKKHKIKRIKI